MKKHLVSVLVLFVICAVVSVLLAVVNGVTAPIIAEKLLQSANEGLYKVMPNGGEIKEVTDLSEYTLPTSINKVYSASNGGYVFEVTATGYKGGFTIMCGIDANGVVTGALCLDKGTQTLGVESTYGNNFVGMSGDGASTVDTISGATMTTDGYRVAIKDAYNASLILGGGEVDIRTPEQILNDNLNAALGTEGVEFDKHFFIEVVEGVDAIYVAKNGAGHVVVIGEEFIGVDADGNVIGNANEVAANAVVAIKTTGAPAPIDLSIYKGISKRVKSAAVTEAGVYVLEVEGSGFGKKGSSDYGASGEYILIKIAVTADGNIVDCLTLYQSESEGFGDVCGTEKFYGQFAGMTQENYTTIIISGSTYTTEGYHGAIKNAFKAVAIIEGGANNE